MHEEPAYASFPPAIAGFTPPELPLLPGQVPQHSHSDFDAMKRSFEATAISSNDQKQRFQNASGQPQQQQQQQFPQGPQAMMGGAYTDVYGGAQAGNYGGGYGAGAPPFIPQAQLQAQAAAQQQQQQHGTPQSNQSGFSNPGSPYLGVGTPNTIPFGSPSSQNGNLPQPGSFNGSSYSGQFDTLPSSPNPNPYAQNPYAGFGGLGFNNQAFMGMMPGMLGMGSPQLGGSMQMQQGMGFGMPFPMMGQQGLGMAMPSATTQTGRTVYVGNLPSDASVDELLSQVRFGPIDSVKILPEKSCAFISFLDPTTAAAFHSDALMRKIRLHDQDLKLGWGRPSSVAASVLMAVQQSGATRNVYLGNLDESVTEQTLRDDLSRFGPIDQVKIVRDKNIGFVHFLSIATAIKVVQTLATEPEWAGRRIFYGKDRCAYVPKNQHQQQQHNMAAAAMGSMAANYGGFGGLNGFAPGFGGFGADLAAMGLNPGADPNAQLGNRTVYLGNIHPETTTEEICNTIRGGILQQIRYIPDKHICFVTFVDAQCALAFYQTASFQGIALHNRRLKVGFGKNSGPTSPGIAMVVQSGGSRNVYIGNIEDFDLYNEERLRKDFGEYGEIELINTLREKQCAFVNFTNIANAIKAIEGMKAHPEYTALKIAYGKDRCGNAPRSLGFGAHQQQNFPAMRSPYADGMGFDQSLGGPSLEAFDPTAAIVDFNALDGIDGTPLALGAGALVLDETVASAAA